MFTIESVQWDKIKLFWEKWKNYDITVQTYGLNIKDKVYTNTNVLKWESDKTLGFYKDEILLGCGKIQDFRRSDFRIAGISDMCVDPAYRNNGIGSSIMEIAIQYIKNNHFDFSMLYPSLYSKMIGFYERFGYVDFEKVMILDLGKVSPKTYERPQDKKAFLRIINSIDKF